MTWNRPTTLTLDIETGPLTDEGLAFERQFLSPNANTKDEEKRQQQLELKGAALKEKSALSPSAPVISIGIYAPEALNLPVVLHTFPFQDDVDCVEHVPAGDETGMLSMFRDIVDKISPNLIITANGKGFDLPKLRLAYAKNRESLPKFLQHQSEVKIVDVLFLFARYFMPGDKPFISLDECLKRLGVMSNLGVSPGKTVKGSDIPKMLEEEKWRDIVAYNALDVLATYHAWRAMS